MLRAVLWLLQPLLLLLRPLRLVLCVSCGERSPGVVHPEDAPKRGELQEAPRRARPGDGGDDEGLKGRRMTSESNFILSIRTLHNRI